MKKIKNKDRKRIFRGIVAAIVLSIISIGISRIADTSDFEKPIPVFVSIEPQVTFVQRIGADRVTVEALVLPGESPATYFPTVAQMARLAKSKLFFRIGVPFEAPLIKRIQHVAEKVKIIDTREGIQLRKMDRHIEALDSSQHHFDHHTHRDAGDDPHIWLNPLLVKKQAITIRDALISIDPDGQNTYEANCRTFINELDMLHQKIKQSLLPVKGGTIFVFHPSFGYFADAYGLKQMAVETEGKAPKGRNLSHLIKLAKKEDVRVVFVQPQFDQSAARKISNAINGVVIPMDPLARDYFKNMQKIADKIRSALAQ